MRVEEKLCVSSVPGSVEMYDVLIPSTSKKPWHLAIKQHAPQVPGTSQQNEHAPQVPGTSQQNELRT